MKQAMLEIVMAIVLALIAPWYLVSLVISAQPESLRQEASPSKPSVEEEAVITVKSENGVVTMPMEEYLTAVLLAEMPASFHMEAKMAQAVVARTYALRTVAETDKHPGAVCIDSNCCQGFLAPDAFLRSGGSQEAVEEAREAVRQTANIVLTYNGDLIDATFFSCSGGYTEPAIAVWGNDVPYLQAVPSPGEEGAEHYTDTVVMESRDFASALGLVLTGHPESWIGAVTYTQGGGVAWMVVGGKRFSGTQLRSLLQLRSTAITVAVADDKIRITTKGYGHRVGMSQYGANAMAVSDHNWQEILAHYYPLTQVELHKEK